MRDQVTYFVYACIWLKRLSLCRGLSLENRGIAHLSLIALIGVWDSKSLRHPVDSILVAGASGKVHAANESPIELFIVICYGSEEPQSPIRL